MNWQLIEGDCAVVMPTLSRIAHVITDPPYDAESHTPHRRVRRGPGDRNAKVAALDFAPLDDRIRGVVAAQAFRLAERWVIAFCQAEAVADWRDAFVGAGLAWRRSCVWIKPDGMPQLTGDRPGTGYESIAVAHAPGRSRWSGGGRSGVFVHNKTPGPNGVDGRNVHPTTKPLPLMLELVSLFTDPGDIVLDPFAGSGTTGVACLRLGRRFIGIEKDPKYAALARERLDAEDRDTTLQALRDGQTTLFGTST